jgi:hypothetical protein
MPHTPPSAALKKFNSEHPELTLHQRSQRELSAFLVYWAVEILGLEGVDATLLKTLFTALDLAEPAGPRAVLAQLESRKLVVKSPSGYKPSAKLKDMVKPEINDVPPLLKAAPHIEALLGQVSRADAKSFLDEAYLCLRANAPRAAIVMTWVVVVDHLYEFVLAHKLPDFNTELSKKNWKLKKVSTKDEFSEIKEKDFIEVCRAASVFSNDVRKILDEKLGIRNTAGHPSTVTIHGGKAANFIEDLVDNVILKLKL